MTASGTLSALHAARRLRAGVAAIALCAMLGSCAGGATYNDFDTAANITKKDYESLLGRRGASGAEGAGESAAEPPIPGFQSVIAAPAAPELADTRRVSIAVTESTPVRDILIELARKAGVDLEMDPRIAGGVIMTATDRPFVEVIERLTELAELRYRFERNTLRVEVDDPYMEQYQLDVLNLTRQATSSASSSTDASSTAQLIGATGGASSAVNKSDTSVSSTATSDFWGQIRDNIGQILVNIQSRRSARYPELSATFVPQSAAPAPAIAPGANTPVAAGVSAGGPAGAVAQAAGLRERQEQIVDEALNGGATEPAAASLAAVGGAPAAPAPLQVSTYSVNPQSGIVTVFANKRQQAAVERYLRSVRNATMQQVLIEAKILEVTLDDQHRMGIDWRALLGPNDDLVINTNFNRSVVPPTFTDPTISLAWANSDGDLSLAAQLIKQFGTVRTLSSPRLTVTNNQVALLKVAQNQVFFDLEVQEETDIQTNQRRITVDSQIRTVPVGIVMSVQPAVDAGRRRINLSLRPSITRITGFVDDPGVALQVANINRNNSNPVNVTSQIPIIETREVDSMITLLSGQTMVMGGLMQEEARTTREGIPGAMDIPLLGQALSQNIKENKVTELVIFIRATLANDSDTIADEDIRLYKTFAPDPRPIAF